ncbi:hypothetical protein HKD37_03G007381 [Glycine soja]
MITYMCGVEGVTMSTSVYTSIAGPSHWMVKTRFLAAFRVGKNVIEVPLSYHRQWRPYYPIYFFAPEKNTSFEVDVMGPIHGQSTRRSGVTTRRHNQWQITIHDGLPSLAEPWFQYLFENNLMPGDEVVFFFKFDEHAWELLYRKEVIWDDTLSS